MTFASRTVVAATGASDQHKAALRPRRSTRAFPAAVAELLSLANIVAPQIMSRLLPILLVIAFGCLLGCSDPGHWSQATVESKLKKELDLASVTLTNMGGGHYTGVGQTAAGVRLTIKVTQNADTKEMSYGALDEQGKARGGAFRRH